MKSLCLVCTILLSWQTSHFSGNTEFVFGTQLGSSVEMAQVPASARSPQSKFENLVGSALGPIHCKCTPTGICKTARHKFISNRRANHSIPDPGRFKLADPGTFPNTDPIFLKADRCNYSKLQTQPHPKRQLKPLQKQTHAF